MNPRDSRSTSTTLVASHGAQDASGTRAALGRRPLRAVARRLGVAVVGALIVLVGLVLVPLPGPGWPVVFIGLSFLGREFPWAARLSTWAQRRVRQAVRWVRRRGRPPSGTSGAGGSSAQAVAVGR